LLPQFDEIGRSDYVAAIHTRRAVHWQQYSAARFNADQTWKEAIVVTLMRPLTLATAFIALMASPTVVCAAQGEPNTFGRDLPIASVIPFALLLGAIAVLPLAAPHWWEHNRNKGIVAALLAIPLAIYLVAQFGHAGLESLEHAAVEYMAFMALLGSLFVISGGIYVQGSLSGTPLLNSFILVVGAVLANLIGTTGASVVLIRPLLRANAPRLHKVHIVVFFIFVVSNCGGLLTPLGDPPLFLGFLKGVPFEWTLQLWPQWMLVNGLLLLVFNIWDQIALNREERERPGSQLEAVQMHEPLRLIGIHNILLLAANVVVLYAFGRGIGNGGEPWPLYIQAATMIALALLSYFSTGPHIREKNRFSFGPIIEVAVLFAGIFATMVPALAILNAWGQGERDVLGMKFGMSEPWQFFWATGSLSSFLDNAPTYLTFAATASGLHGISTEGRYLGVFLEKGPEAAALLAAISCGAVFMGANTYIGNGPNFMVKAIAEENGVRMPGFFGYMAYSISILIPIFLLVTLVFFR
jgi:Na+/H+ antiporter NhaD/arsenite permease-like protein